ncbi:MAG: alpha-xylosidase, partial [Clostridiales bacterium]|nr:alpha-xylosidase [Clostridiales bacterium]
SNFMDKIQFDVANREFMEAYFEFLHHPLEDAGVDFWWIDWQQQGGSSLDGVDPLWMLNHFHYADIKRKKERPLVLSRYAGTGSHRYPLGFSGDTCITWKSLEFQPKFTSAASCAGYGWWSHDIGGHFKGIHSAELQIRWLQLGVFSPIMRLHSSNSRFSSKDPWRLGPEMAQIATNFLRLRHSLIPYIYTMMELFNRTGAPLIQPMFFREPTAPDLWGQYWFGTQLIACPITSPMDQSTKLGGFKAWLPQGIWHDIFTGETYDGGRFLNLHRGIETIPVLAKAGAIIPMSQEFENGAQNPARISLWVFSGSQGEFSLYEDNGAKPESIAQAITRFTLDSSGLTISAPDGDASIVPENRVYQVKFMGFGKGAVSAEKWDDEQGAAFVTVKAGREKAFVPVKRAAPESRIAERVFSLLQKAEIEYDLYRDIYELTLRSASKVALLGELEAMSLPRPLASALTEIVAARIGERI